ncbi:MAG: heme-binding protein [Pseudomonadota bacterium]
MNRRILISLLIMVGAFAADAALSEKAMAEELETPDYTVISTHPDKIEIRRYEPMILAEVSVSGNRGEAANKAFYILFDFIDGGNLPAEKISMTAPVTQSREEKIAMTAPVTQSEEGDGVWKVAFVMPPKYTMETLPRPKDDRIRIYERPAHKAAAIRFSGRYPKKRLDQFERKLLTFLDSQRLRAASEPQYAFYDGPFTPFFLRRNEILIELSQ